MKTITRKQIHELCQILGNISGLEIVLQKAIDSNNLELIGRVQAYLTVVKERLDSAIEDIDR